MGGIQEALGGSMEAGLEGRARVLLRLAERVCASHDPARIAKGCATLRENVLDQCAAGAISPGGARDLCHMIDGVQAEALAREARSEETARFREHFVGIVGHDLRNPLTAIVTSAQLLLRHGGLDQRQSRVAARISSAADRMARMIDDLLDFARSRLGGGFPINPRRIDLRALVEHTVEELLFVHTGRTVRIDAEGDPWGNWDPDRMAQVVGNLVGNALQHGDGEVRVMLRGGPDSVVLETQNGGPAIPPEVLPWVFEPGRRGHVHSSGLGLGLYIVQQIVLAHGGSISARSVPGETVFSAVLPRLGRGKV